MKSLFLRIFLSFWMAFAMFLVTAILVTLALRPRSSTWEALRTAVLNDSVSAYEEGGEHQLRKYMDELESTQHVRAYLFDEQGEELSHRAPPDWAIRVASGGPRVPRDGFIIPAPPMQRDSRASSDGKPSLHIGFGHAPRSAGVYWPAWHAAPCARHPGDLFRDRLLFPVVVFDQADRASARRGTAAGGGRSRVHVRERRRRASAMKSRA